jgi:predicted dehydrogenase
MRVAIVGAGMIGRAHAHAFRTIRESFLPAPADLQLAVVADANDALAREAQVRFGFERIARSWEAVAEASDVDVVSVVLPNHQHRAAVEALVASGKHVLCEKPLAPTAEDALSMLQAARRAGVVHAVGFNLRRAPAIAAIQLAVARGEFGELRHFSARYFSDYALSPDVPFSWRYERARAGGGALHDVGSHVIDIAHFLVGEIEAIQGATEATFISRRPVAVGDTVGHSRAATTGAFHDVDTDDTCAFTVRFRGGAMGTFQVSRIAAGFANVPAFELFGSSAAAAFSMERAGEFQFYDTAPTNGLNGMRRVVVGPDMPYFENVAAMPVAGVGSSYTETFVAQAYEFVRAVASGSTTYRPSFEDGYAAALVCDAVQRSAAEGVSVQLSAVSPELVR